MIFRQHVLVMDAIVRWALNISADEKTHLDTDTARVMSPPQETVHTAVVFRRQHCWFDQYFWDIHPAFADEYTISFLLGTSA